MDLIRRGNRTAVIMILTTASLIWLAACEQLAEPAGESYDLFYGLEQVENAAPTVTIHQGPAVGREAWFEFEIDNIDSDILEAGVYDGWCIEWTKPIAQEGDTHENLRMYSTYGKDRWKPLNYFLNIKNNLQADDPDLGFREFQAVIWTISEGPEFDLDKLSNDEIPERLMKDGEPRFNKQKVQEIAANVKANSGSFTYDENTAYAMLMRTGDNEQDVMVTVNPPVETVSHGYVEGVTPGDDPELAERTYPVVQADWSGPGGDKRWLGWNLGATDAPQSIDDNNTDRAGWYFQFNRKQGYYHDGEGNERIDEFPVSDVGVPRDPETDSDWTDNDPCTELLGDNWRIPTREEWTAAASADAGVKLNLHFTGSVSYNLGALFGLGEEGYYWTSTQYPVAANAAHAVSVNEDYEMAEHIQDMKTGLAVRCIED